MNRIGFLLALSVAFSGLHHPRRTSVSETPPLMIAKEMPEQAQHRPVPGLITVQYVSPSGNDTNDGLSWTSSKRTIFAALTALPGGSTAPPASGSGTVYVAEDASASPFPGGGIWIMGSSDPNYARPPAGWLKIDHGSISIIGVGCKSYSANTPTPKCHIISGDSRTSWSPSIWISGSSSSITFENLFFAYPGKVIALGIASNHDRSSGAGGTVNVRFDNVAGGVDQAGGLGPTVDIGSNTFNIYFEHTSFAGNAAETAAVSSTGLSRSGGILTVRTSAPTPFTNGEKCGIVQAWNPTFNGSFGGHGITVKSATEFTVPSYGPNGASGGGYVICDRAIPVVMDPGEGANLGLVWFRDTVLNGGGIRTWSSSAGSTLYVEGMLLEGDYKHVTSAPVWIGSTVGNQSLIVAKNIVAADTIGNWNFTVQNDSHNFSDQVLVEGCPASFGCLSGPGTILAGSDINSPYNPLQAGQVGFFNGHVVGQLDAARSAPQSVRFPNLAKSDPKQWSLSNTKNGSVLKTGVADRDGGTQAARASTTVAAQQNLVFGAPTFTPSTGEIVFCGVWVRSLASYNYGTMSGAGYSGSPVMPLSCSPHGVIYTEAWHISHGALNAGDNEWEWVSLAYKIAAIDGSPDYVPFAVSFDSKHPIEAYSPVFVHVPAGVLSDGEAANFLANLRGYSNSCTSGQVCDQTGPLPHLNEPNDWTVAQHFSSIILGSSPPHEHDRHSEGSITYATELTDGQCFSAAFPADCARFVVGFVSIPAGKSSVVVNTTAVTPDSLISLTFDSTQGARLHVTCNSAAQAAYISERIPGRSFTISVTSAFAVNPGCIGFRIVN